MRRNSPLAAFIVGTAIAATSSLPALGQPFSFHVPQDNSEAQADQLSAGGPLWGLDWSPECVGFFALEPGIVVTAQQGRSLALFVGSEADTTLAVKQPDGTFACNDDAFGTSASAIYFDATQTGDYLVWPGTFEPEASIDVIVGVGAQFPTAAPETSAPEFERVFAQFFELPADNGGLAGPETESTPMDNELAQEAENLLGLTLTSASPFARGRVDVEAMQSLGDFNEQCVGGGNLLSPIAVTAAFQSSDEFIFFADGGEDLTLLVIAPDGTAACNDDFAGSPNPLVSFDGLQPGVYQVFLGTFAGERAQGVVHAGPGPSAWGLDPSATFSDAFVQAFDAGDLIDAGVGMLTEGVGSLAPPKPEALASDYLTPTRGTVNISDNTILEYNVGGAASLFGLSDQCTGFADQAATFALTFDPSLAGQSAVLRSASNIDGVLAVLTPDGQVLCNDDGPEGLDPQISFAAQGFGAYKVWVGSLGLGTFDATISIEVGLVPTVALEFDAPPLAGLFDIGSGTQETIDLSAFKDQDNARLQSEFDGCTGIVTSLPLADLNVQNTAEFPLVINAKGAVLIIGPNNELICSSAGPVSFDRLPPGLYRLWVGLEGDKITIGQ